MVISAVETTIIHTGTAHERPDYAGVALVLNKQLGRRVRGYVQYNERIILEGWLK